MKSFRVNRPVTLRAAAPWGKLARARRVRGHVRSVNCGPFGSFLLVTVVWDGLKQPETIDYRFLREVR